MNLYESAKEAAKILKEAGKIKEYQKILDLIDDLFNKREEIEKLKVEIRGLKEKAKVKDDYYFEKNSYWHKESKAGPFCSRCIEKEQTPIRLIPTFEDSPVFKCPECKNPVEFANSQKIYSESVYNFINQ